MTQLDSARLNESRRRGARASALQLSGHKPKRGGHPLTMEPGKDASGIARHPHAQLGAAILMQSYKDIFQGADELALDAVYWLAGVDGQLISGTLGFSDPLSVLCGDSQRDTWKVIRRRVKE